MRIWNSLGKCYWYYSTRKMLFNETMFQLNCCFIKFVLYFQMYSMTASEILDHHKVKKTAPRIALLHALQEVSGPQSEGEIKDLMGELYDRATFYRSVQTLTHAGIIHRIVADNVMVKYALNNCENGHHHQVDHAHFYCRKCHNLFCLKSIKVQALNLPAGFVDEEHDLVIRGICNQCSDSATVENE
ncbi:Fur family ferric uptake transcriptional regulator [Marinilabilia salmonicolor]|uniref:Fur family ferric uptake transcriptional regulator n=2 Tax=Marinilabilia salmonicolor TaxID=989 RepID=A0A368V523_9BACT|nr:Fur family ferric uptake transcriptional regulator [Marinilabilia salmonicolor]